MRGLPCSRSQYYQSYSCLSKKPQKNKIASRIFRFLDGRVIVLYHKRAGQDVIFKVRYNGCLRCAGGYRWRGPRSFGLVAYAIGKAIADQPDFLNQKGGASPEPAAAGISSFSPKKGPPFSGPSLSDQTIFTGASRRAGPRWRDSRTDGCSAL